MEDRDGGRGRSGRRGRWRPPPAAGSATGQILLGSGQIWPEEPAAVAMAEKVGRGRDWRRADGDEAPPPDPRLLLLEDEGAARIWPATPLLHRIRAGPGATTADRGDGADATGGGRGSGTVGGRRR